MTALEFVNATYAILRRRTIDVFFELERDNAAMEEQLAQRNDKKQAQVKHPEDTVFLVQKAPLFDLKKKNTLFKKQSAQINEQKESVDNPPKITLLPIVSQAEKSVSIGTNFPQSPNTNTATREKTNTRMSVPSQKTFKVDVYSRDTRLANKFLSQDPLEVRYHSFLTEVVNKKNFTESELGLFELAIKEVLLSFRGNVHTEASHYTKFLKRFKGILSERHLLDANDILIEYLENKVKSPVVLRHDRKLNLSQHELELEQQRLITDELLKQKQIIKDTDRVSEECGIIPG